MERTKIEHPQEPEESKESLKAALQRQATRQASIANFENEIDAPHSSAQRHRLAHALQMLLPIHEGSFVHSFKTPGITGKVLTICYRAYLSHNFLVCTQR